MDDTTHWLANYVMLSRATSMDGLLILRRCQRRQLTTGAPQFLVDELERLCKLERASTFKLKARLGKLESLFSKATADVFRDIFSNAQVGSKDYTKDAAPVVERDAPCTSPTVFCNSTVTGTADRTSLGAASPAELSPPLRNVCVLRQQQRSYTQQRSR